MLFKGVFLKNRFNGKILQVVRVNKDKYSCVLENGVELDMNKLGNWVLTGRPKIADQEVKAQPKPFEGYVCENCGKAYKSEKYYNQHIVKCNPQED